MPHLEDRITAMIWGQFLGDAACLGTHWIYSLDELYAQHPALEGFEAPAPDHYHAGNPPGAQTHYGLAASLMLESVGRLGYFKAADFGARFIATFSDPAYTGYCDGATKGTLANYRRFVDQRPGSTFNYQQGADDDQLATATRLAPVVAAHLNDPALLDIVEAATRVCQNNDYTVAVMKAHALLLRALLYRQPLMEAAAQIAEAMPALDSTYGEQIQQMMVAALYDPRGVVEATLAYGQACPLAQSFPAALHAATRHPHNMRDAILGTLAAGGDNAGRAAMIGAWLGAAGGEAALPSSWVQRLVLHDEIAQSIATLMQNAYPHERSSG